MVYNHSNKRLLLDKLIQSISLQLFLQNLF